MIPQQQHMILVGEARDIGEHFRIARGAGLGAAIAAFGQLVAIDAAGIVRRSRITSRMPRFSAAPEGESADGASIPIRMSPAGVSAAATFAASTKAAARNANRRTMALL